MEETFRAPGKGNPLYKRPGSCPKIKSKLVNENNNAKIIWSRNKKME